MEPRFLYLHEDLGEVRYTGTTATYKRMTHLIGAFNTPAKRCVICCFNLVHISMHIFKITRYIFLSTIMFKRYFPLHIPYSNITEGCSHQRGGRY